MQRRNRSFHTQKGDGDWRCKKISKDSEIKSERHNKPHNLANPSITSSFLLSAFSCLQRHHHHHHHYHLQQQHTTMFEARLVQGKVFKQIIESIKDLIQDANMDCSDDEIAIQSMDSSHVSLVAVSLRSEGLDHYRCDRSVSLGFNSQNLSKILKCAGNDDIITLKSDDNADSLTLMFESPNQDRIADFGESSFASFSGQRCSGMMLHDSID